MNGGCATLAGILILLSVAVVPVTADITDPGLPRYTNNMFGGFITPTVSPGETVNFSFNLTNSYSDPTATMTHVVLTVGIYKYATQESARDVNSSFKHPPLLDGVGTELALNLTDMFPDDTVREQILIKTAGNTPHGSYFSQSTYFLRFKLEFNFAGNSTVVHLQSRGYFTDEQWAIMVSFKAGDVLVNTTYMKSLGVDGLIPDSSFGIKVQIPRWPLAVLVGACVVVLMLALYYFVLDNPGKYPKLEKRFYYLRGKLSELRSKFKHGG